MPEIAAVFSAWDWRIDTDDGAEPAATLVWSGRAYRLTSPHAERPTIHETAVNALCDLAALLPYALAAERGDRLWLHAAAVAVGGRAILIPAERRGGKSLLTAALAAQGAKVIADDVTGVSAGDGQRLEALASGVAPRLRLPLPGTIDPALATFIAAHAGPGNRQYLYLRLPDQPRHDAAMPFGAVILLDRQEAATQPRLVPAPRGEVLRRLLHQHFTRDRSSATVMAALDTLARTTRAWRLSYAEPWAAARLLSEAGTTPLGEAAETPRVRVRAAQDALAGVPSRDAPPAVDGRAWRRALGADLRELDGDWFAVSADGGRIVHLDQGAMRIWALLAEPTSPEGAASVLAAAFPAAEPARVAADTLVAFREFHALGLVRPA